MGVVKTYCNVTACWASLPLPHSSSQTAFIHSENAGTASRLFPAIGDYHLPKLWRTDSNGEKGTQKQLSEINKLKKKNPSKCSFFCCWDSLAAHPWPVWDSESHLPGSGVKGICSSMLQDGYNVLTPLVLPFLLMSWRIALSRPSFRLALSNISRS